jgi:hypothetical protein
MRTTVHRCRAVVVVKLSSIAGEGDPGHCKPGDPHRCHNSKVSYNVRKRDSGAGLSVLTALNLDREVRLQEAVDAQ